jgi:FkbM family methyltransferase
MNNKLLKKISGFFGYKLVDKNYIKNNRIIENTTYLKINKMLNFLFNDKKIHCLIQIGANDGLRFDILNQYIKKYKTKSILVEPIKKSFIDLMENYKDYNNVIFENVAISVNSQISHLYKIDHSKEDKYKSEHFKGIMSFDKGHLIKHGVKKIDIVKEEVESISINNLIKKHKLNIVDLLFVDAEGYDAYIIEDFLKTSLMRPIIIFEYLHVSNKKFKDLVDSLNNKKYFFFSLNENMVCFPEEKQEFIKFN